MKHIYVDESRLSKGRYQLFGSLWLEREAVDLFRSEFWQLWDKEFPSRSELKWTKISKDRIGTYKKFIDLFSTFTGVDLRCVVLDTHAIDYRKYHDNDRELGFYKFLYFFLSRNIEKDYNFRSIEDYYQIFLDKRRRVNGVEVGRLEDLKKILNNRLDNTCSLVTPPCVRSVEAIDSKDSPEVQIVDVLTGAIGYVWDGFQTSKAKLELIDYIENLFGLDLGKPTPYLTERLNIWEFRLK